MYRIFLHKILFLLISISITHGRDRWTPDQAFVWFNAQKPYIMGTEYMTSSAVNQLEMWQAETFDADLIDKEMTVGQQLGMTAMRIFLHDLAYSQDPQGFKTRMHTVLKIMEKYGIKPLWVFFTNGASPTQNSQKGKQPKPVPGVESSDWARTPSKNDLSDQTKWSALETYVKDIVGTFSNDSRVLGWDMWNEPDDGIDYNALMSLFPQACAWARSMNPIQPLTSCLWAGEFWKNNGTYNEFEMLQINNSDVISFHNYADPNTFESAVLALKNLGRPIIATEYMARTLNSEFMNVLPIGKKYNIGMISWGFVNGKTQFNLPWDSGKHPYVNYPPTVWFQDILRNDRSPYLIEEAQIMRRLNGCPFGYHSTVNNWTCYNAFDNPLSYTDVKAACNNIWANVVAINNAFENNDIRTFAFTNYPKCNKFYIGLSKTKNWTWPMTTPYNNPTYRNWQSGYPIADANSNCVVLNKDGSWTNEPCNTPECYICSY